MAFGNRKQAGCAFLYCIIDEKIHTIPITRKKMVIGNTRSAKICLEKDWIGKKMAQVGQTGDGGYYFQLYSDRNVWVNGYYQNERYTLLLEDRDSIFICGDTAQENVFFWFRADDGELQAPWSRVTIREAAGFLPVEERSPYWYIRLDDPARRILVNKQSMTGMIGIIPGTAIYTEEINGVFIYNYFYYQILSGKHMPSSRAGAGSAPQRTPQSGAGGEVRNTRPDALQNGTLGIDIEERAVNKAFGKKVLLRDIHVDVQSGQMVLILGGSGAGKTTFMNAVIGYEKASGSITYNSIPLDELRKKANIIGFVPQNDILRQGDTVRNSVRNAAEMKLPESVIRDRAELNRRIDRALERMRLKEKERERVSKLSGGEKKRLSVAMEYIGNPKFFFLDEPDSGLDGAQALNLMHILREIADEGKIVMIISHSPDRASSCFDRVLVLAKNKERQCGELAFYGSVGKALSFFGAGSLEEAVGNLDDRGGDRSDEFIMRYRSYDPGRGGLE